MRRHRWVLGIAAASCGLVAWGTLDARDRAEGSTESESIRASIATPFVIERSPLLRTARETTIFLPQAEFLFAPLLPEPAPR